VTHRFRSMASRGNKKPVRAHPDAGRPATLFRAANNAFNPRYRSGTHSAPTPTYTLGSHTALLCDPQLLFNTCTPIQEPFGRYQEPERSGWIAAEEGRSLHPRPRPRRVVARRGISGCSTPPRRGEARCRCILIAGSAVNVRATSPGALLQRSSIGVAEPTWQQTVRRRASARTIRACDGP
jgi:hypothetical protein